MKNSIPPPPNPDPSRSCGHREAPLITSTPKIGRADFYAFNSDETGRTNYVTFIANYIPLQDAYGGPNYFQLDTNALYEIHVDNTGDAREDDLANFADYVTHPTFPAIIELLFGGAGAIAPTSSPHSLPASPD